MGERHLERHAHIDAIFVISVIAVVILARILGQGLAVQFHDHPLARAVGWLSS